MTTLLDASPDNHAAPPALPLPLPSAALLFRRAFAWSVRREIWEHRSLYLAPIGVAGLVLLGFLLGTLHHSASAHFDDLQHSRSLAKPYDFAAVSVLLTMLLIGLFYSLGTLFNERRDRTILFWKSLPVSDLTTVLSKASIPLVVLPAIAFGVIFVLQMIMLLIGTAALLVAGQDAGPLWMQVASVPSWIVLGYSLLVLSLWHAPVYGWLLLVSGWAKRAPFLWALLPPLALCLLEKFALNTSHIFEMLMDRFGGFTRAYAHGAFTDGSPAETDPFKGIDPMGFFSSQGLWLGLAATAALLAAAVWLRRRREAI